MASNATELRRARTRATTLGWPSRVAGTLMSYRRFIPIAQRNLGRVIQFRIPQGPNQATMNAYSGEYIFTFRSFYTFHGQRTFDTGQLRNMLDAITDIRQLVLLWTGPGGYMQFTFSDGVQQFSTVFTHSRLLNPSRILRRLQEALNSNETFMLSELQIKVKYGDRRRGGCTFRPLDILKKRCVVTIKESTDHTCFFQAIAVALALSGDDTFAEPNTLLKEYRRHKKRVDAAEKIRNFCNVAQNPDARIAVDEMQYYEDRLNIGILVIDALTLQILKKPRSTKQRLVALLMDDNHFHAIHRAKIGRLWTKPNFCPECLLAYNKTCPQCKAQCTTCGTSTCTVLKYPSGPVRRSVYSEGPQCESCGVSAFDETCLLQHRHMVCAQIAEMFTSCKKCSRRYHINRRHRCAITPNDVIKAKGGKPKLTNKYVYYDFECTLDDGIHNPALIVMFDEARNRTTVFEQTDPTDAFVRHIVSTQYQGYTFIAHNAGKYDFHFVKRCLLRLDIPSDDLGGGRGIIYSYIATFKIRFIDSLRFLPFALRKFPKTFGLTALTKGHFPYRFYTQETRHYVGPIPALTYFEFDRLQDSERQDALEWYESYTGRLFDIHNVCVQYCKDDVRLLAEGCKIFRKEILEVTDNLVDPFQQITIAGVALEVYLRFFMPPKSISIIPPINLTKKLEAEVLQFYGHRTDVVFFPCYESGCPECFGDRSIHRVTGQFMSTTRKVYNLNHPIGDDQLLIRECFWMRSRIHDDDVKTFLSTYKDCSKYCHPRDSFFGGRTEVFVLYHECAPDEKIRYLDFTSLYPSVQFGELRGVTETTYHTKHDVEYPVGPHETFSPAGTSIDGYFGFIKCRVKSPDFLLYPILPVRFEDKLLFPLGVLTGTWCTIELQNAVQHGYTIEEIFQVWHYPNRTTTLFKDYVRTFLTMKQNAIGWAKAGVEDSDEDKKAYVDEYEQQMGITLDMQDQFNPGKYSTAKLLLNSLWGKFAQRLNYVNTVDTRSYDEFSNIAFNEEHVVKDVVMHDSIIRTISYESRTDCVQPNLRTNVAVASFTTAHARTRLYEVMQRLEGRLLYCDTDSVIFVDDGTVDLKCGAFLGDLTDELDAGDHIVKFVATAPKSYAYITAQGKSSVKLKGVTLDGVASKDIHFDSLKLTLDDPNHVILTRPLRFDIDTQHNIRTRKWGDGEGKEFKYTFNKRRRTKDYDTKPFYFK